MRRELGDQRDRTVHPSDNGPVTGLEIVADQFDQRGERVFASTRRNNWSGDGLRRASSGEAAQRFLLTKCLLEAGHHIGAVENRSSRRLGVLVRAARRSELSRAGRPTKPGHFARDPVEVAEFFLGRIERDRENPSFILVTRKRALEEAEASRKRRREGHALGPLDGVPIAWKDLVDMAGERTTAGSALYADAPPKERDARIVTNLAAAGMVALGKTNLSEFAFSALGLNPHFGTPRNPRDPATPRVAGGSSSGAAVAVAGGLAPCAIGSDTGGSIRQPAALCGVVGVKPTYGYAEGYFETDKFLDIEWAGQPLWGYDNNGTIYGNLPPSQIPALFYRSIGNGECYYLPANETPMAGSPGCR